MDKVAVGAFGSAALAVALAISIRWGHLDQSFRNESGHPIARVLRRLAVIEVSGLVAGLLVGGLGSRLMMRIIAATSSAAAQGKITEAGEIVGRVTSDGTGGLIIFVGLLNGLIGAALYAVLGRFLPRRTWLAGVIFGLLVLGAFARGDPLDPHNRDFAILSPVALAVAIIVVLFVLYGTTLAALAARLERLYPVVEKRPLSLVAHAPLLLLVLPPLTLALLLAIFIGALQAKVPRLASFRIPEPLRQAGLMLILVAAAAGNVYLGLGIADILSAA